MLQLVRRTNKDGPLMLTSSAVNVMWERERERERSVAVLLEKYVLISKYLTIIQEDYYLLTLFSYDKAVRSQVFPYLHKMNCE